LVHEPGERSFAHPDRALDSHVIAVWRSLNICWSRHGNLLL
jgi:hypothetical protein